MLKLQPALKSVNICRLLQKHQNADSTSMKEDFYFSLQEGFFPQERKLNTVECVITTKRMDVSQTAKRISVGQEPRQLRYHSIVHQHQHQPKWNETVHIDIENDEYSKLYVQIDCIHWGNKDKTAPERKLVGYFYPTSLDDGSALADGSYDIPLYKVSRNLDPISCIKRQGKFTIIFVIHAIKGLFAAASEPIDRYKLVVGMVLRSHLISQNPSVHALINWREKPDTLPDTLNKFSFVEMKDVLQCFIPIVQALLEVMEEQTKMQMFAYNTLIFVFGLLVDDKTEQYAQWMDKLGDKMVLQKETTVHSALVQSILYYLSKLDSTSHAKYIRGTIRSLPHLVTLLSYFYATVSEETKKQGVNDFMEELKKVFSCLNELLSLQDPLKVALQSNCLQVLAEVIPKLEELYNPDQLVDVVTELLIVIKNNPTLSTQSMTVDKLLLVQSIANCKFYLDSDCSIFPDGLLDQIVQFLNFHLGGSRKEMIECSYCLSVLLDGIQRKGKRKEDAFELLIPLLSPLSSACAGLNYDAHNQLDLMTAFLSILHGATETHFKTYFSGLPTSERYSWLQTLCSTSWKILLSTYPSHWFTVYVVHFIIDSC